MNNIGITLVLLVASSALAQPFYKATWDVPSNTNVAGYRVLMGTASGQYTATNSVEGRLNNTVTLSNAPVGIVYLVGVAYALDGTVSIWSTPEVKWTNRSFAPRNFKLAAELQVGRTSTGPWTNLADVNMVIPAALEQQFYRANLRLEELR